MSDSRRSLHCGEYGGLQSLADFSHQQVGDLGVARNGLAVSGSRIPVNRVRSTLALQRAAVGFEVPDELLSFHPSARGTSFSPTRRLAVASSRRSSKINKMDSLRDSRASSSVDPCPLPSGNSGEKATNHLPSLSTRAVKEAAYCTGRRCIRPIGFARMEGRKPACGLCGLPFEAGREGAFCRSEDRRSREFGEAPHVHVEDDGDVFHERGLLPEQRFR
jgi:hypothetical protein